MDFDENREMIVLESSELEAMIPRFRQRQEWPVADISQLFDALVLARKSNDAIDTNIPIRRLAVAAQSIKIRHAVTLNHLSDELQPFLGAALNMDLDNLG